ncbi:MAG: hypothetical protein KBD00_01455 [Candidatus Peribacteraceae bacterium]|nr:hypothetical protein [Candidatus Peribacteraceae bacterium]
MSSEHQPLVLDAVRSGLLDKKGEEKVQRLLFNTAYVRSATICALRLLLDKRNGARVKKDSDALDTNYIFDVVTAASRPEKDVLIDLLQGMLEKRMNDIALLTLQKLEEEYPDANARNVFTEIRMGLSLR